MRVHRVVPDFQAHDSVARRVFTPRCWDRRSLRTGWIVTFAVPDNPAAQISPLRQDASAAVQPDVSIEVDDVDAA
jgi:hypothetical protein